MMIDENFFQILSYLNNHLWEDGKTTATGWKYSGLILDWYFENSFLSVEYLDVENYMRDNGGFPFNECKSLNNQFENIPENKRLLLLQNILNILKQSTANKEHNEQIILTISNVLKRYKVKVNNPENGPLTVLPEDILDSGSYCNVVRVADGILRKELKPEYRDDETLKKRMRYEYENMKKLDECTQVLNVYDFNTDNCSYLMEQGDKNLYKHLNDEIDIPFEDKLKIIIDILIGMNFAHENSIIHRDLHLGNVLKMGKDFVICDFGLSKDLSIERSLKSSHTQKNNHIFVDPAAGSDFTKLDKKSDIYSIGKIIDYVFSYNASNTNHIFKTIVERCICRDKGLRYDSANQIIAEIDMILKNQGQEEDRQKTINKIQNNQYDSQVHQFIIDLVNSDRLSKFIVTNKLFDFGKLIIKFESIYQEMILHSISSGYVEATGYGGWSNYDIFAQIAYYLCINAENLITKNIAKNILEECANIRYKARDLFEALPD